MRGCTDTNFYINLSIFIVEGISNIQNTVSESMHSRYSNVNPE